MPFAIDQFRANLQFGGARPNQFDITLPTPGVPAGINSADFAFKCRSASIPPEDVGVIVVPYFGRQLKLAGDRTFPEWTVTIFNDEDFGVRDAFETWSNSVNGHVDNLRNPAGIPITGYMADATVNQYGKAGNVIATYVMVGCWPSNVSAIDLAWDNNDRIEEFQVTFQYQWWQSANTV